MKLSVFRVLLPAATLLLASTAPVHASGFMSNSIIDAVARALSNEPSFKNGGYEGKIGYYMIRLFRVDWPVKSSAVRATWDIDSKQDTDGDGKADIDDDDIDGDGIPNHKDDDIDGDGVRNRDDRSPFDSTKQFSTEGYPNSDRDGDGVPDMFDTYPNDPDKHFVSKRLQKMKDDIVKSMW